MRIIVDVDGVLRDTLQSICEVYNRYVNEGDVLFTPGRITHFNLNKVFPKLSPEAHKFFFIDHGKETFLDFAPPIDGFDKINLLYELEYEIIICTNQPKGFEKYTIEWLERNEIKYHGLTFLKDKGILTGDVMIDDHYENLRRFCQTNPNSTGLLYDQPHNSNAEESENIKRVYSWNEIVDFVEKLRIGERSYKHET